MSEPTAVPRSAYIYKGYTVLVGPNKANPALADAAVIATEIRLMGLDPKVVRDAVNSEVDKLPPG